MRDLTLIFNHVNELDVMRTKLMWGHSINKVTRDYTNGKFAKKPKRKKNIRMTQDSMRSEAKELITEIGSNEGSGSFPEENRQCKELSKHDRSMQNIEGQKEGKQICNDLSSIQKRIADLDLNGIDENLPQKQKIQTNSDQTEAPNIVKNLESKLFPPISKTIPKFMSSEKKFLSAAKALTSIAKGSDTSDYENQRKIGNPKILNNSSSSSLSHKNKIKKTSSRSKVLDKTLSTIQKYDSNDDNNDKNSLLEDIQEENNIELSQRQSSDERPSYIPNGPTEYMKGTTLYYGSTIGLQNLAMQEVFQENKVNFTGKKSDKFGFLRIQNDMNSFANINANGIGERHVSCGFKIWRKDDFTYNGAVRYGDRIWLQTGRHDILGTLPKIPCINSTKDMVQSSDFMASNPRDDFNTTNIGVNSEIIPSSYNIEQSNNVANENGSMTDKRPTPRMAKRGTIFQLGNDNVNNQARNNREEFQKREKERAKRIPNNFMYETPADLHFGYPTTISCRDSNAKLAHLRGTWVILNKHEPRNTLGRVITHLDEVVIEQEFAYLSCSLPEYTVEDRFSEQTFKSKLGEINMRQVPNFKAFKYLKPCKDEDKGTTMTNRPHHSIHKDESEQCSFRNGNKITPDPTLLSIYSTLPQYDDSLDSTEILKNKLIIDKVRGRSYITTKLLLERAQAQRAEQVLANEKALKLQQNIYGFPKHMCWKIYLAGLPADEVEEEERQRKSYVARCQLKWSKDGRNIHSSVIEREMDGFFDIANSDEKKLKEVRTKRNSEIQDILLSKLKEKRVKSKLYNLQKLANVYGPNSLWALELHQLRLEDEERKEKDTTKKDSLKRNKNVIAEGNKVGEDLETNSMISELEENKIIATTLELQLKVPTSVVSAIMRRYDKRKAAEGLRQIRAIYAIKRCVRNFRENKWRKFFKDIDEDAKELVELENRPKTLLSEHGIRSSRMKDLNVSGGFKNDGTVVLEIPASRKFNRSEVIVRNKKQEKKRRRREKKEAQKKDPNNHIPLSVLTSRLLFKRHYIHAANSFMSNNREGIFKCKQNDQLPFNGVKAKEIHSSRDLHESESLRSSSALIRKNRRPKTACLERISSPIS